jgi:ribosomal protein S6
MDETHMPATEAEGVVTDGEMAVAYELAFHVLPTVAEGEVTSVTEALKAEITKFGGRVFDQELPERFDLAYDIDKYLEGRHRAFSSAYFGWVRFYLEPAKLPTLAAEVAARKELLRHLLIRLTREEEQAPFRFHQSIAATRVKTITDEDLTAALAETSEGAETPNELTEASSEEVKE